MRKVLMATGLAQYVVKGFPHGALGINLRQRFVAAKWPCARCYRSGSLCSSSFAAWHDDAL